MEEKKTMLDEEIEGILNTMKNIQPDSDKYGEILADLVKLYNLMLAEKKMEYEFLEKEARREMEERHYIDEVDANYRTRKDELNEKIDTRKFQIWSFAIGTGVTLLTACGSMIFHNHWLKKSFVFEEKGSIAGATSKGVFNPVFKIFKK